MKKLFIINGSGASGKDTFVEMVRKEVGNNLVFNYSSIDLIKNIARKCGWDNGKTEKDRMFLSELKRICTQYNDLPMKDCINAFHYFMESSEMEFMFLHIREPEEIVRTIRSIELTNTDVEIKTILIKRHDTKWGNLSDDNVEQYSYDIVIENDEDLNCLANAVSSFIESYIKS